MGLAHLVRVATKRIYIWGPAVLLIAVLWRLASGTHFVQLGQRQAAPAAAGEGQTRQVTILYTGYGRGAAVPVTNAPSSTCGACQGPAVGGLARRATYLKQALGEEPGALLVDTGGTLTGEAGASGQRTDEQIARALAAMGYDALNAGSTELRSGSIAWQRLAEASAPDLVSSNGRLASAGDGPGDSGTAVPAPYLIREVAGVRVGIVGVTSPSTSGDASRMANLTPPVEALRALLPEVRQHADVIVALADLEPAEIQELAAAGLDLQVVLGGRVLQCQSLTWVGQTAVVAVGGDGRYVGRLTLQVNSQGRVVSAENEIEVLTQNIEDDPSMVALLAEYE